MLKGIHTRGMLKGIHTVDFLICWSRPYLHRSGRSDLLVATVSSFLPDFRCESEIILPILINLISLWNATVYWQGVTLFGMSDLPVAIFPGDS